MLKLAMEYLQSFTDRVSPAECPGDAAIAVAQAAATIALVEANRVRNEHLATISEQLRELLATLKDAEWITHDCANHDGDAYHVTSLLVE